MSLDVNNKLTGRKKMKLMNFLGYVAAILIIAVIVSLGFALIQTDGQLAVVLVGMITIILGMGLASIYMRSQRYTHSEMQKHVGSYYFQYISTTEQKLLQGSIVLAISMIVLGILEKGPKIIFMVRELIHLNG